jgi:hypothetical protein
MAQAPAQQLALVMTALMDCQLALARTLLQASAELGIPSMDLAGTQARLDQVETGTRDIRRRLT